jgi:hypothetical protein
MCPHDRSMCCLHVMAEGSTGEVVPEGAVQVWTWGYHTWEDSVAKALLLIEHSLSAGSTSERRSDHLAARPCTLA